MITTRTYPKVCDSCKSAGIIPEPITGISTTRMCPACNGSGVIIVTETIESKDESLREELIKWMEWYYEDGGIDDYTVKYIDEYLKENERSRIK